jgi:transposase
MRFLGVDIHYDSFVVATMDEAGEFTLATIKLEDKITYWKFKNGLTKDDYVAIEASTNSFWFYDEVQPLVNCCYVINPGKFKDIGGANKKTDKIDAKKIANKLRYKIMNGADEDEFPTVFVPSKEIREIRSLFTTYELYGKNKVMTKNRIYSLFVQTTGRDISKDVDLYAKSIREGLLNIIKSEIIRASVKTLYDSLDFIEKQMGDIKEQILKAGFIFKDEIDKLVDIKGISVFTAIGIMVDIADIKRFSNSKKLTLFGKRTDN